MRTGIISVKTLIHLFPPAETLKCAMKTLYCHHSANMVRYRICTMLTVSRNVPHRVTWRLLKGDSVLRRGCRGLWMGKCEREGVVEEMRGMYCRLVFSTSRLPFWEIAFSVYFSSHVSLMAKVRSHIFHKLPVYQLQGFLSARPPCSFCSYSCWLSTDICKFSPVVHTSASTEEDL